MDMGLMLGKHLLTLYMADITYIYRKCLQAMTFRFNDNFAFLQLHLIESPFTYENVKAAMRKNK